MWRRKWSSVLAVYLADRLPARVVYACLVRVWAYTTTGVYSRTDALTLTMDQAVQRWYSGTLVRHDAECNAYCIEQQDH